MKVLDNYTAAVEALRDILNDDDQRKLAMINIQDAPKPVQLIQQPKVEPNEASLVAQQAQQSRDRIANEVVLSICNYIKEDCIPNGAFSMTHRLDHKANNDYTKDLIQQLLRSKGYKVHITTIYHYHTHTTHTYVNVSWKPEETRAPEDATSCTITIDNITIDNDTAILIFLVTSSVLLWMLYLLTTRH